MFGKVFELHATILLLFFLFLQQKYFDIFNKAVFEGFLYFLQYLADQLFKILHTRDKMFYIKNQTFILRMTNTVKVIY